MALKDVLPPQNTVRGQIRLCAQFAFVRNLEGLPFPDRMSDAARRRRSKESVRTEIPRPDART